MSKKIMEDGGYFPDELNDLKNDDNDDNNEQLELKTFTNTSYDEEEEQNSSFGGTDEKQPLLKKDREIKEAEEEIRNARPRSDFKQFLKFLQDVGKGIKLPAIKLLGRKGAATYVLIDGEFRQFKEGRIGSKLRDGQLKTALGPTREEILEENKRENKMSEELKKKKMEERKSIADNPTNTPEEKAR